MISAKVAWKLLTKTARVLFVNHSGWCFMFWKSELYKAKLPANSADALLVPRCRVCHGEDCFVLGAAYYELGINAYFLAALESPIDVKIRLRLYLPSSGYFDIISSCPKPVTRNLLSWNLTRTLDLIAQCCPFALFGCIPLFAWTRLNFIAG